MIKVTGYKSESCGPGQRLMATVVIVVMKIFASIKGREITDQLSNYYLIKKGVQTLELSQFLGK
jgi:hypothetical protein